MTEKNQKEKVMKNQEPLNMNNLSHHPFSKGDIHQKDRIIDLLSRKYCPIHLTPLVLYNIHDLKNYIRKQYGCVSCRCTADFVGDELKSDSVARTFYLINLMKEERELATKRTYQTDDESKDA